MEAAAKADMHTGGVISESTPQYRINMWTASVLSPWFTTAGASVMAKNR
jgi:hypothetical protein